jgi:hypothetical protein
MIVVKTVIEDGNEEKDYDGDDGEDGDEEKDVDDEEEEEDCDDDFGGITFGVDVGIVATTNPPQAPDSRANHKLSLREARENRIFLPPLHSHGHNCIMKDGW